MRRQGFTLIECAAAVLVVGALVAVLQPAFEGTRRGARVQTSRDNLRFWGVASASYINDHGGLLPAYSWEDGAKYNVLGFGGGVLTVPADSPTSNQREISAISWQETDILRRLTGRSTGVNRINVNSGFNALRRGSHLILVDYLGLSPTTARNADPSDHNLVRWQSDPLGFEENGPYPVTPGSTGEPSRAYLQRWPYSSSYRYVPASYAQDARAGVATTVALASSGGLFNSGSMGLGGRRADEVAFPAQKVFVFEWHDRHSADQGLWYAYPDARPNKLRFDGSAHDRPTGDAGLGWDPNEPDNLEPDIIENSWLITDPPPVGNPHERYPVRYYFTRGGLAGIDYTP